MGLANANWIVNLRLPILLFNPIKFSVESFATFYEKVVSPYFSYVLSR